MNATKQDIKFDSLPYYDKEIDSNSGKFIFII